MLYQFWFSYWWPSVKGNGPEDVTSMVLVGIITALLIPAVRRWFERGWDHVHDRLARSHDELHRKLDHIIEHHPDIPDLPPIGQSDDPADGEEHGEASHH